MLEHIKRYCALTLLLLFIPTTGTIASGLNDLTQWQNPFEGPTPRTGSAPLEKEVLSLSDVLFLVQQSNPGLQAAKKRVEESVNRIRQAGLRPNPELAIESESVSGSLAGLSESETNVILSQEFELWGKRGNRKNVALKESDLTRLGESFRLYETYAEAVTRFSLVAHGQRQVELAKEAVAIAESFVTAAKHRVTKGATLSSELSLGELELQRAELDLQQFQSDLLTAKTNLVSLWKGASTSFSVTDSPLPTATVKTLTELESLVSRSSMVEALQSQQSIVDAELTLQRSNAKPNITVNGGYRRLEADNANTFVVGIGFPLPISNRNQGEIAALKSRRQALELEREQALLDANASFRTLAQGLDQSLKRRNTLDSALLPKAEETYKTLKEAYKRGRISYPTLLESQRTLIDLRFELNDIDLIIREKFVSLERLLGVTLN